MKGHTMTTETNTSEATPNPNTQYIGEHVCIATAGGSVGFYNTPTVAQQTVGPAATDLTTAIALVNEMRAALIALGLVRAA